MNEHEKKMIGYGCPECEGEIELYDTDSDGMGGKYRCKDCGRDTIWKVTKALSMRDLIERMGGDIEEYDKLCEENAS